MCIAIDGKTGCDIMNFEVNLIFLIRSFFLHDQNVATKTKYIEKEKSFPDEIKTIFHHFKRFSIKQMTKFFFWKVRESDFNKH